MSGLEVLPLLAIPTLVCTIVQTVAQCKKLALEMRAQKIQRKAIAAAAVDKDGQIADRLVDQRRDICNTFNNCVVVLGGRFTVGDAQSIAELQKILADLQGKKAELEEGGTTARPMTELRRHALESPLQSESTADRAVDDAEQQLEKNLKATKLCIQGLAFRRGFRAIPHMSTDSASSSQTQGLIQTLLPSYTGGDADFCPGALYLQQHPSEPFSAICSALPDGGGGGYRCDYCSLEFRYVGIRLDGLVVGNWSESEWRSLARYHIQASVSWGNLAAWYMCAICRGWNHCPPQIFASPVAFRLHMKSHK